MPSQENTQKGEELAHLMPRGPGRGVREGPNNCSLMLGPSLRTFFKRSKDPFFTAGYYRLLVRILLYAVLELGARLEIKYLHPLYNKVHEKSLKKLAESSKF